MASPPPRRSSLTRLKSLGSRLVIGGSALDADAWTQQAAAGRAAAVASNFFDLSVSSAAGNEVALAELRGRVCLCVNVASF